LTAVKSDLSRKIYDVSGVPMNNGLFLRVQFKESPVIILIGALIICTIIFGFGVQIFERAIELKGAIGSSTSYDKFSEIANSLWVMILGITTVGYGDIVPITHIARIIVYAGCFIGNIILILMTVAIFNAISHNKKEL
jgi:hypothetical protein